MVRLGQLAVQPGRRHFEIVVARHRVLDVEQRAHGQADLLAVVERDAFGTVNEYPHDAAAPPELYLEVRQLVTEALDRRLQQRQ